MRAGINDQNYQLFHEQHLETFEPHLNFLPIVVFFFLIFKEPIALIVYTEQVIIKMSARAYSCYTIHIRLK